MIKIREFFNRIRDIISMNIPEIILLVLIVLFLIVYLAPRIFITIRSGEAGVLYKRFAQGTVVDKFYGEGIHVIWPWDIMTIYNVRYQQFLQKFDVLTSTGLNIQLSLSIRYVPDLDALGELHKKVGPDYVNRIVVPEVENVLRTLIGKYTAEEIYSAGAFVLQEAVNQSLDQASERFVIIDDVIVKTITLPPEIEQAIQNKEKEKQLELAYDFKIGQAKKEAQRKRIEAQGFKDYNDLIAMSLQQKPELLTWQGIQATLQLSVSENAKVVVIGGGKDGLPIILGTGQSP